MPRIVSFIGVDGTGKTNLIELVRGLRPETVMRRVVNNPHLLRPMESEYLMLAEVESWNQLAPDDLVIYDRTPYPDDYVYGGTLTEDRFPQWDRLFSERGVKFVYCEPADIAEYVAVMSRRPDEHVATHVPVVLMNLLDRYYQFFDQTKCRVFKMSHHQNPLRWYDEDDARRVLEFIEED